ncbi:hypothetical protein BC351_01115 [Paenibacillus ferrarius]|uniref:Uncharacterized protein n=1 Tax=Paenibacillus ferrarius TaxID=1469647 RepID=A0A1V4HSG1_9BACL|nr:hypothetical protein [Paenibacillus ferrarius]OPH61871.1 hypothetical protein BC351_01115 [Paenibacillus ferrarius]
MSKLVERQNRIDIVNRIIQEIGNRGRNFFYKPNHHGYAHFTQVGKTLFYYDDYTGARIYPYEQFYDQKGFSHGGTLWGLVNDFRYFIVKGTHSNGKHGYGGLLGAHWAYPEEDMKAIQLLARELGYIQ